MGTITGADLRAEREAAGVRAVQVAGIMQKDPAAIARLEDSPVVDVRTARNYRRAIAVAVGVKRDARRDLIRELAGR